MRLDPKADRHTAWKYGFSNKTEQIRGHEQWRLWDHTVRRYLSSMSLQPPPSLVGCTGGRSLISSLHVTVLPGLISSGFDTTFITTVVRRTCLSAWNAACCDTDINTADIFATKQSLKPCKDARCATRKQLDTLWCHAVGRWKRSGLYPSNPRPRMELMSPKRMEIS